MLKKTLILATLAASLLIPAFSSASTSLDTPSDITITATVETYFEWDSANVYAIDKDTGWTGGNGTSADHIGKPGDVIQAAHTLTVNTNADPSFQITGLVNGGVLTEPGTTKLKTSYMISSTVTGNSAVITPAHVGFQDAEGLLTANAFDASNAYALTHNATGKSDIKLEVKAEIPSGVTLPTAADYSCTIKVTATW